MVENTMDEIEDVHHQIKDLQEKEKFLLSRQKLSEAEISVLQAKVEELLDDLSDSDDSDSFPFPEDKWKYDLSNFGWKGLQPLTSVKDMSSED